MKFDKDALTKEFYDFCSVLKVETKELGIVSLGETLLDSQRYFIDEVFQGLSEDIHYFVCLKARQMGISTICLALDLFWHFKFPGTQGTLATDTEENREMFRSTLTMYMESLPREWKLPVKQHNRTQVTLANRSRMVYQVAGTRKNVGFGAGKAIMFMHATECGKWGEGTDLSSLEASLAEQNPLRLFIFESTAYGMNDFNDMWDIALTSESRRAIFIGWWRNSFYSLPPESEIYKTYWDGTLTNDEAHWVGQVKEIYDYDITDGQMAWWRWKMNEACFGDEMQMHEKYPPTADFAFVTTGSQFFSNQRITDQIKIARHKPFDFKRFVFGGHFEDTELLECNERTENLKIWQMPVPRAHYVIGADPAWGSSEWADRHCINVSRCWADGMEQVAEYCTTEGNTVQYAWVLLYLAGAYGDKNLGSSVMINLEINGPGQAVLTEIQGLKRRAAMVPGGTNISNLLNNIDQFLYRRVDSTGGGFAYHTKTTSNEKDRFLNMMKDYHEMGLLVINSEECLNEMKNVVRDAGTLRCVGAPGRKKDDRVISQALAVAAWNDFIRIRLIQSGITRIKQQRDEEMPESHRKAGRTIENYLKHIGLTPKPGTRYGAI